MGFLPEPTVRNASRLLPLKLGSVFLLQQAQIARYCGDLEIWILRFSASGKSKTAGSCRTRRPEYRIADAVADDVHEADLQRRSPPCLARSARLAGSCALPMSMTGMCSKVASLLHAVWPGIYSSWFRMIVVDASV